MPKADQFGLWPHSARTPDALSWKQIKSCLPFSNSNPQFKPTDIITSAVARKRMKSWEVIADNLSKAGWSWGCVSAIEYVGVPYDAPLGKSDTVPGAASLPFYHPRRENVIRYAKDMFSFFYTFQLCTQPLKFRLTTNALFHHSLLHRFYR